MPANDTKVMLRMPKEVREALAAMADKDRRSFNAQVLVLLEKAVREHAGKTEEPAS